MSIKSAIKWFWIEIICFWMKNIWSYFAEINGPSLWKSVSEVLWMTAYAFFPLAVNIFIATLASHDLPRSFTEKIIPGEMLSYCLSFLAPSLYLLNKIHGTEYKLPLVKIFTFLIYSLYALILVLYLIAKNKWVKNIDLEHHDLDFYLQTTLVFLLATIALRVYSLYHGSFSNWSDNRKRQQEDFNNTFTKSINN